MRLAHYLLFSVLAVLCFSPQSVVAQSCEADANTLCLLEGRFSVQLDWRDSDSNLLSLERVDQSDQALAIPRDDQTGFLALDTEDRVDALVKVLDGRAINNSFWVFAAIVTAREYTLTVTDTMTEEVTQYFNPLGQLSPTITDTQAFPQTGGKRRALAGSSVEPFHRPEITLTERKGTACATDQGQVCLGGDRFEVGVTWRDFAGNTGPGTGEVLADGSAIFWFFTPDNLELIFNVEDAAAINGNFWYGFSAATDVEFTLTVVDLQTGLQKAYFNPLGNTPVAVIDPGPLGTTINRGHSGFWFNPETSGQGISVELHPELNQIGFLAFYGFEPAAAAKLGAGDQRWLTGQGQYAGDTLSMELFSTTGGLFNDPQAATTEPVGSAQFMVDDCRNATLVIELPDDQIAASIPVQRLLPQSGGLADVCAAISLGAEIPSLR